MNPKKRKADDTIEEFILNTASGQEDEITRIEFLDFDNAEEPKHEINKLRQATNADLELMKQDILEENIYLI